MSRVAQTARKSIDQKGESGQTFWGMLGWVRRHRPPIVIQVSRPPLHTSLGLPSPHFLRPPTMPAPSYFPWPSLILPSATNYARPLILPLATNYARP